MIAYNLKILLAIITLNVMLYIIFIVFLIVLVNEVNQPKPPTCSLGVFNVDNSWSSIVVAYQSIIAAISGLLSISFIVALLGFSSTIKKTRMGPHTKEAIAKIHAFAILCTIFFLIRSILFLYTAITKTPIPVLLWSLVEFFPLLGLFYLLFPKRTDRRRMTQSLNGSRRNTNTFNLSGSAAAIRTQSVNTRPMES